MASENETVAEIVREIVAKTYTAELHTTDRTRFYIRDVGERVEAAHKREVVKLAANLDALAKAYDSLNAERVITDNDCTRLRRMLRAACVEACHDCEACVEPSPDYTCVSAEGSCFVQEWRKEAGLNCGKESESKEVSK